MKEAAWQLVALTEDFTKVREKRQEIEKLEHKSDPITHDIYKQLRNRIEKVFLFKGPKTQTLQGLRPGCDGVV